MPRYRFWPEAYVCAELNKQHCELAGEPMKNDQLAGIGGYVRNSARFPAYWCENKVLYSPKFAEELDVLIGDKAY